jgi:RNA polymerase sigma-70 factor (ECF subfamily)
MHEKTADIDALLYSISVKGDEWSYIELFNIFFPPLMRYAYCFVKSRELAEEVASDVMIAVWENRQKLCEIGNIKVYLFCIAKNKCLNLLKSKYNRATISLEDVNVNIVFNGANPEQLCINSEILRKVEQAVNALPQRCKLIFKMVKEERMSYKEVAEILGISVKTVDAQLVTALKKIALAVRLEYKT